MDAYMVHVSSPWILANTAWSLLALLVDDLWHKLSIIMLIRRSAGCFKGKIRIFYHVSN